MVFSSTGTPLSGIDSEPVAMMKDCAFDLGLAVDRQRARRGEGGAASDAFDLVLAEQIIDPAGVGGDHLVLPRHHGRQVERHVADLDAVLRQRMLRLGEMLRRLQQRLRRDAADIEAGAAERGALFDAGDAHAELRRADRRDIAARPAADHDDVEIGH